jgi:hypothetical protein
VLDDGALSSLAQSDRYVREFSFLAPLKAALATPGGGSCSACRAARLRAARDKALAEVKQHIAGMPKDRMRALKEMLSAEQVRVYTRGPKGVVETTF